LFILGIIGNTSFSFLVSCSVYRKNPEKARNIQISPCRKDAGKYPKMLHNTLYTGKLPHFFPAVEFWHNRAAADTVLRVFF